jgi:hypothetical protein
MRTKLLLQKMHLTKPAAVFFRMTRRMMKQQLLGKNPSLRIFDLYKLGLICSQSNEEKK